VNIRNRVRELRQVKAADLVPNPRNWRTHPKAQQDALRGILAEVGYADALLARELSDGSLMLVDGHLRAETTPEQEVPVLVLDISEAEADKLLLSLDPLAALAETNAVALDALLREVDTGSEGLQQMYADLADAAELYQDDPAEIVEDEIPAPPADPITKPGDLWLLGDHRLVCGDSTKAEDVELVMAGKTWRLCVTSPPYNQKLDSFKPSGMHTETKWVKNVQHGSYFDSKPESEYQSEQIAAVKVWAERSSVDASIFYNHKNRYREKQVVSPWVWLSQTGMKVRQEIIWKREGSVTQNARMFMPCDERIFWLYCGDDFYFDDSTEHKTWSSVWQINSHKDREESMHGCAFPIELASRPIRACSEKRNVVFEPYCGSGTTLIAAEQLGRKCYGMEISPAYCDVIVKRWETLTGKKATLEVPNGKTRAKAGADHHQDGEGQPRKKAAQQKRAKAAKR
jgi:DNA modification methylase